MPNIQGFGQLMEEVKMHVTTTSQAAERVEKYVQEELARRVQPILDLEIGLHSIGMVQHLADGLEKDFDSASDSMILKIIKEYASLRQRFRFARERMAADHATKKVLPPGLQSAQDQLYAALRNMPDNKQVDGF